MRARDKPNLMTVYGMTNLYSEGFWSDVWSIVSDAQSPYIAAWIPREDIAHSLDRYYYFVHSGDKTATQLLRRNYVDGSISEAHREIIAKMFLDTYGQQLNRLWADYVKEYDPLQPYDVTEETDYGHEADGSVADGGDITVKRSGTEKTTVGSRTDNDKVYGFDSVANYPVGSNDTTYGEVAVTTKYGFGGDDREDKRTLNTTKTTHDESSDDLTTHKYGTLGTQPVADILNKEIEVWMWNFYLKCLFPFADKMLTIPLW